MKNIFAESPGQCKHTEWMNESIVGAQCNQCLRKIQKKLKKNSVVGYQLVDLSD